jgi:hypothetical protein
VRRQRIVNAFPVFKQKMIKHELRLHDIDQIKASLAPSSATRTFAPEKPQPVS